MRPKFIAGIILGSILLYIGLFGSQGFADFGLQWTSSTFPMTENFDNLNDWTTAFTAPIINPAGQVNIAAPANGRSSFQGLSGGAPGDKFGMATLNYAQWTAIVCYKIDDFGGSSGWAGICFYDTHFCFSISFNSSMTTTNDRQTWPAADYAWHEYSFLVSRSGATSATWTASIDIYRDLTKLGTIQSSLLDVAVEPGMWDRWSFDNGYGFKSHVDFVKGLSGLVIPSGGTTQDRGSVNVFCQANSQPVSGVTVSCTGQSPVVSDSSGHALFSNVPVGTYTVSATYNGKSPTGSVTVLKDQTVPITLDFSASQPNKATLSVSAVDKNGASLSASVDVKKNGASVRTGTTPCSWNDLDEGTYEITISYGSEAPQAFSKSITSASPGSVTATFNVGGNGGEDWLTKILNQIRAFIIKILDNPSVRTLCTAVGSLTTIVSVLIFVWPQKKHGAPPPPPRYYPPY